MQKVEHTPQTVQHSARETVENATSQTNDKAVVTMTTHAYEVNLSTYPTRDTQFFADSPLMRDTQMSSWLPVPGADF